MATTSLVSRTEELSKHLKEALQLLPSDDPMGLDEKGRPEASFLFEMVVLHALVVELKARGWTVEAVPRNGKHRFPRGPALKANHSWIRLERDGTKWQLVHGTQIRDRFGKPRAPDLSLQKGDAPLDPEAKHVVAIWDAKLRGESEAAQGASISDGEFRSFLSVLYWLNVPEPGDPAEAPLASFPPAFEVRGLITNGKRPTEPDALFLHEGVGVTEHFATANTPCHPARHAHLGATANAGGAQSNDPSERTG